MLPVLVPRQSMLRSAALTCGSTGTGARAWRPGTAGTGIPEAETGEGLTVISFGVSDFQLLSLDLRLCLWF